MCKNKYKTKIFIVYNQNLDKLQYKVILKQCSIINTPIYINFLHIKLIVTAAY